MRIIFILIAAVTLAACSSNSTDNQFRTLKFEETQNNENPNISFEFKGAIDLPDQMEDNLKEKLRTNIISVTLGSNYADFMDSRLLKKYSEASFSEYKEMFDDYVAEEGDTTTLETISCVTNINGKVRFSSSDIISYERALYIYSGGAHGMTTKTNYIFDLNTGDIITEEDIFKGEYHRALHNILADNAMALRNDSVLPSEQDAFFNNSLIQPNGNVSINDSAVVYTFNPYEIAPYYFGSIEIEIHKDQMKHIADTASAVYRHLYGR